MSDVFTFPTAPDYWRYPPTCGFSDPTNIVVFPQSTTSTLPQQPDEAG